MSESKQIVIGTIVKWKSASAGTWKSKTGKVVEVVARNANPKSTDAKGRKLYFGSRNHEWYVINVDGVLYFPRVSLLKPLAASEPR